MNKFLILITVIVVLSCRNNKQNKHVDITSIEYTDTLYDLGKCIEGDTIDFYVKYKNVGKFPLNINLTQGSCSCTQPESKIKQLNPNLYDSIHVYYYSQGQSGIYRGTVVVAANTSPVLSQTFFNIEVVKRK